MYFGHMSQLIYESDSDTPDVPIISYTEALDFLEGLRLFRLQTLMLIDGKASSYRVYYIGKSGIWKGYKAWLVAHSSKQQSRVF